MVKPIVLCYIPICAITSPYVPSKKYVEKILYRIDRNLLNVIYKNVVTCVVLIIGNPHNLFKWQSFPSKLKTTMIVGISIEMITTSSNPF